MPPKRMTANPLAPLRYRPGKAIGQEDSSSEEEDSNSDSESESKPTTTAPPKATSFPKFSSSISKAELERRRQEAIAARAREVEATKKDQEGFETASESEDAEEEDSDEEESDEEESEEEAAPARKFIAPVFVSKAQRNKQATAPQKSEEDIAAEEEARRRERADQLLQAQIEKDAAARAAGRKAWDDDDDAIADEVDDTDDLDPEAERAAWKLRELRRIKREREAIEAAEAEREEIERRRNLTVEEREAEDRAHIEAQQDERQNKGQMGFMQKYFHKGAFFQDDGDMEELSKRDIMGSKFADDAGGRELLPQYMQIRDMTQLGRKGRTKYKDLKSEDTGRWGDLGDRRGGPGYAGDRYKSDKEGATGANASMVGERRRRDDDHDRGKEKRPRYD